MTPWKPTVTKIVDGTDAVDAMRTNRPVADLEQRTNYLKERIDSLVSDKARILRDLPLSADTYVGCAVYLDPVTGNYTPGLAKFDNTYATTGALEPAQSALIIGVVTAKSSPMAGDVLVDGMWTADNTFLVNLFGTGTPAKGLWFLDASLIGKATQTRPDVSVPLVQYAGDGLCVFFPALKMATAPNHIHKAFDLLNGLTNWSSIYCTNAFDNMTIPSGYEYGYIPSLDPNISELLGAGSAGGLFLENKPAVGYFQISDDFLITEENVWCKHDPRDPAGTVLSCDFPIPAPEPSDVRLYAISAISHGHPVVRAVESTTLAELSVTAENGYVKAGMVPWSQTGSTGYSPTALSSVVGRKYRKTNIISGIGAGPGAAVCVDPVTGYAVVGLDTLSEQRLIAAHINLNNARFTTDDARKFIKITLPAGISSSITGEIPIGKLPTGSTITHKAKLFVEMQGSGQTGQPLAIPTLAVGMLFSEAATTAGTLMTTTEVTTATPEISSTLATYKYYTESTDELTVDSEGTLYVKLGATSPAADVNIMSFGAIVRRIDSVVDTGAFPDPVVGPTGITIDATFDQVYPMDIFTIPAGRNLNTIDVEVRETWDGSGASLILGTLANPTRFFTTPDTVLTSVPGTVYSKDFDDEGPITMRLQINPGSGAFHGVVRIQITLI